MEVGEDDEPLVIDNPLSKKKKHTLTVPEMLAAKAKEREKEKKIPRTPLTGFKIVRTGTFTWAGTGDPGGFNSVFRNPSLCHLFETLCPQEVIQMMLAECDSLNVKGAHQLSISDVRQYQAVRIWITGKKPKGGFKKWKLPEKVFGPHPMGKGRYIRLSKVWLGPFTVQRLNAAAQSIIDLPEVITIDEKLKGFTGSTPYRRFVPNKDPSSGHWITESTMKGPNTGMPFLINAIPVQQEAGPTMLEFYQGSLAWLDVDQRKKVVVVSDAYYMDNASRLWLRSSGFKYLCAINPVRFAEVWEPLKMKVKKKKHVSVAWCSTTGEAAVHFWTHEGKKVYILTNAFSYQPSSSAINTTVFSDTYCHLFNTVDRLNHYIYQKGYPWRREGWQYSFDNFHFTTLLWNVYTLYHELQNLEKEVPWKEFCVELAKQLWSKYHPRKK